MVASNGLDSWTVSGRSTLTFPQSARAPTRSNNRSKASVGRVRVLLCAGVGSPFPAVQGHPDVSPAAQVLTPAQRRTRTRPTEALDLLFDRVGARALCGKVNVERPLTVQESKPLLAAIACHGGVAYPTLSH